MLKILSFPSIFKSFLSSRFASNNSILTTINSLKVISKIIQTHF